MNGPIPADPDSTTPSWLSTVTGCEIRSTEWIGIDFGLSGHCCRVIGRNLQGEEVDVVVKLTTDANAAREIAFYRHYAPDTPIATPRFLGGEIAGDRGYLVLETVVDATQGDVLAGTSRRGAEAMAGTLARLHGRWWNDDSALEPLRRLSPPKRSGPPVLLEETVDRFLDTRAEDLSAPHRDLVATLRSRLETIHQVLWGGARTLIHTDAHLDNVLWRKGEPVFLDWEGAMVGPPEIDVARLLIEGMTPAQYGELGAPTGRPIGIHSPARTVPEGRSTMSGWLPPPCARWRASWAGSAARRQLRLDAGRVSWDATHSGPRSGCTTGSPPPPTCDSGSAPVTLKHHMKIENVIDTIGNRFAAVVVSARRARQINGYFHQLGAGIGEYVPPQVHSLSRKPLTIAMEEIAEGKVAVEKQED